MRFLSLINASLLMALKLQHSNRPTTFIQLNVSSSLVLTSMHQRETGNHAKLSSPPKRQLLHTSIENLTIVSNRSLRSLGIPLKRALGVSMLKLLSKLFNKKLVTSSVPIDTNVSDNEIWEVLPPSGQATLSHKKENLSNFLKFITSHLNKSESQRLTKAAVKASNE